jgi:D-cysteine desulfhydrase
MFKITLNDFTLFTQEYHVIRKHYLLLASYFILYLSQIFATTLPLFNHYPILEQQIPYIQLAQLPTPIIVYQELAQQWGLQSFTIKDDGQTGTFFNGKKRFGGNKPRKLEFLLADALAQGATDVLTLGYSGSNHALATTSYANALGLNATAILIPQPNSWVVRRNLLLDLYYQTTIIPVSNKQERTFMKDKVLQEYHKKTGKNMYFIPIGGSVPLGALGFVNAAFELKEQINNGLLPTPDRIYCTLSSAGTIAGLLIGLQATGIPSTVYAIRVEPQDYPDEGIITVKKLFKDTLQLLYSIDPTFPACSWNDQQMIIIHDIEGKEYGELMQPVQENIIHAHQNLNITLDQTYSGKTYTALLHDIQHGELKGLNVLFWNTFCGDDFTQECSQVNYQELPQEFQKYFTELITQ